MMRRCLLLAVLSLALAAPAASAELVYETHYVPTVDGAEVAVEIMRDDSVRKAPVLLTYSPYNSLSEYVTPNQANDGLGKQFVPRGYVRAVADVLGTRNSSGCWDYGGPKETQSGVDLVKWLARQPWSNGRVGMIGGSYDGTTANMVASQGPRVPELKAIVPIAAISRWYGYAYANGVRFLLNSEEPADEGFDTPFAFDFGISRTPPTHPDDPKYFEKLQSRTDVCDSVEHTMKGYSRSPDYDEFWLERDYRRHAARFRAATLVAHGWQDYNVKQEEGVALFEALPVAKGGGRKRASAGVPLKRAWFWQGTHGSPSGEEWDTLLEKFLDRYLIGRGTGIEGTPLVMTEGRTVVDGGYESTGFRAERKWPPAGVSDRRLWLRRTFDQDVPGVTLPHPSTGETGVLTEEENREPVDNVFTWIGAPVSEEFANHDPLNEPGRGHGYYSLFFGTAPLEHPVRIVGRPVLDAAVRVPDHGHLSPVLVDLAPDGTMTTIARGFMNVDYRDGLDRARPAGKAWVRVRVPFLPQDVTVAAGHRIGVHVQSSNTVWAVPGALDANNIATGPVPDFVRRGSSLVLPLAAAR